MRIAHLVVPVLSAADSDLSRAQPITFATMELAKRSASSGDEIHLLATGFPEDRATAPPSFRWVGDLPRSVLDLRAFRVKRKLPLLRDVLEMFSRVPADVFVYTNVDIGLQPTFYDVVSEHIHSGLDAFVISRRTLRDRPVTAADLPELFTEQGAPHRGFDCFVFRASLLPQMILGNVCLGIGHVDLPLTCSLIACAQRFQVIRNACLTFHVGDRRNWFRWRYRDYLRFNDREAAGALSAQLRMNGKERAVSPILSLLLRLGILKNSLFEDAWQEAFSADKGNCPSDGQPSTVPPCRGNPG